MNRPKRLRTLNLIQALLLVAVGVLSFHGTRVAFASTTGWISLDTVVPHTTTPGRPGSFTATLYFDEGSATSNRLFNPIDNYITWDSTNASRVNTTSEDFAMAWHIFNYNSSCWRAGVTAALDGNHNPMPGTWWGTNLPNMPLTNIFAKSAGCSQGNGPLNEVRFNVRYHGQGSTIAANTSYYAEATFIDTNYPSSRAWIEMDYNFIHDWGFNYGTHDDIWYENTSVGNKLCVNGYNQLFRGYTCP